MADEGAGDDPAEGHPSPEEIDNERIVVEALRALEGKSKHPEEALNEFIETFGRDELDVLKAMVRGDDEEENPEAVPMVRGRLVEGPGRGLEDRIPAQAGDQPVLLSDGEFVVPADVVSMLGDGSTKAGVRMLEAMIERVRKAKTGTDKQAKAIDRELLPA
jgi:hypothetical protein